jgi:hypothetical protein
MDIRIVIILSLAAGVALWALVWALFFDKFETDIKE